MGKTDDTDEVRKTDKGKSERVKNKRNNSAFSRSRRQIVMIIMLVFLVLFVGTLAAVYYLSYQELYQDSLDMLEMYVDQYRANGNPSQENTASVGEAPGNESVAGPEDSSEVGEPIEQSSPPEMENSSEMGEPLEQSSPPEMENSSEMGEPLEQSSPPEQNDSSGSDDSFGPDDTSVPDDVPSQDRAQDASSFPSENDLPDRDGARYALSSFYSVEFDSDGQVVSVDVGDCLLYSEDQITDEAEALLETGKSKGTYGPFVYWIEEEKSYTLVVLMDNTLASDSFNTVVRNTLLLGMGMVVILFLAAQVLARWIIRPLEESDRRQRQFISDAGHELKTPVSVIEANAELLEREVGSNQWLSNIRSESSRMAGLVHELLTLTKMEREVIPMEKVDLSRLVMGGILPFESIAFEAGRQLDYQIADDIIINGNAGQLSQLVSILMDNALSHSEGEGDISVKLFKEKSMVLFTVSNPGFIPEQEREEIFTRFYRGDSERNDTEHYGLGLTIAKNIVKNHHGEIQMNCEGKRVEFAVKFHL